MKQLLVMRHAKSDWSSGLADHERPLNSRGRAAADAVGRHLTATGQAPDHVFTSSAVRALTTAQRAAAAGGWSSDIQVERDLYSTWPEGALETVLTAPDVDRVMIVGHQPTWSGLVAHLTGASVAMRTATVVGIDLFITDWSDVVGARGEILFVVQPRSLETP